MAFLKDEIVREKILEKAQILFRQYGLKKTTMDEIAAGCGKSKSTLYHYFKSKDEVFDAVFDKELVSLRRIVKRKVEGVHTIREKITIYFISFHQEVIEKLNVYRIMKHELLDKTIGEMKFSMLMEYERAFLTRILEDGYDMGEFVEVERKDIAWFSELMLAAFFGIVKYTIESDKGFDQNKLIQATEILIPRIFK